MNLFLKKFGSPTRNNPSIQSTKNQLNLYTESKSKINNRNEQNLFKNFNLLQKKSNDTIKLKEISKTDYPYKTSLKQKNNQKRFVLTESFDSKKNLIKNICTIPEESSNYYKSEQKTFQDNISKTNSKMILNLKKRNSLFIKDHNNLNEQYEISTIPSNHRLSLRGSSNFQDTFFTSIQINNNSSKHISKNSKTSLYSKIKLRRENYKAIKLTELKDQVQKFEISENFLPNEQTIEKYMTTPDRFINKKYDKKIKGFKVNKKEIPKIFRNAYTIPRTKSSKSRNLYLKINEVEKESDLNKINVKNKKYDFNYTKTDKILKNVLKKINIMNDEVNQYLKEIALEYKKEIGDFTYYNGKGIYTNHLSILKKNDKILAFMLSNNLVS